MFAHTLLLQKYQMMKKNGVPENDAEFLKARNLLATVQRRTELFKRQQQYRQQQQQQQQQAAQQQMQANGDVGGQVQMNGATTSAAAPHSIAASSYEDQTTAPSTNGASQSSTAAGQTPTTTTQGEGAGEQVFTTEQKMTLRAQMSAFGLLQKNMPIPQHIQDRMFAAKQADRPSSISEGITAASKVLDNAPKPSKDTMESQADGKPRHKFETFTDPHTLLLTNISHADHT